MIEIVLLALPIICLLCAIVHFSISLWKLSTRGCLSKDRKRIPEKLSISVKPQIVGMAPIKTYISSINNSVSITSFQEWTDERIGFHIYTIYMKTYSKGVEIHNLELKLIPEGSETSLEPAIKTFYRFINTSFYGISNLGVATEHKDLSVNKEKNLWAIQNLL